MRVLHCPMNSEGPQSQAGNKRIEFPRGATPRVEIEGEPTCMNAMCPTQSYAAGNGGRGDRIRCSRGQNTF